MPFRSGQTVVDIGTINASDGKTVFKPFSIEIPEHSHYTSYKVRYQAFSAGVSVQGWPGNWHFGIAPRPSQYDNATQQGNTNPNYTPNGYGADNQYIAFYGWEYSEGRWVNNDESLFEDELNPNSHEPKGKEDYRLYLYSDSYGSDGPPYRKLFYGLKNVRVTVSYAEEYLSPTKPTSVGLSTKTSYGQPVTLAWSGSTQPRRLNPITGYQIQYSDNGGAWHDLTTVQSVAGYASTLVQPELSTTGTVRRFRVRAIATEPDALYSDWTECPDTLTKLDDTPQMDRNRIRLSKNWSLGDEVVLSWANVSVYWPEENPIIRYEVQYIDSTGIEWLDYGAVTTSASTGQLYVAPPDVEGDYRRFRIRPVGRREAARYGAWVECRISLARRGEFVSGGSGEIHLPRLLDRNLHEICTLYPVKCSVNLKIEPLSSANMTLLLKDLPEEIMVRQFVEVYTKQGSAGIYQIAQISHDYGNGTVKLDLQHGIGTLSDALLPEVGSISGSVEEAFRALLEYQTSVQPNSGAPYWQFGAYYGTGDYNINFEWSSTNLLEGLCEMMEQMGDRAYLDFDQSETPWRLNVMEFPPDISECRLSRNLTSVSVDVDSSLLCTRIYPYGAGEGSDRVSLGNPAYIDADTQNVYGIIARAEVVDNVTDAAVLRTVAEKFLNQHKHPSISISLGAIDLSDATGEEVDGFHIGWTCRVPLPAYGQTYTEHITGIKWSDVYNAPDEMQLTLANESANVADSLADLLSAYETSALANKSLR